MTANANSSDRRLPVIFVGHGSPMNAIEDNEFSRTWDELGARLRQHYHPKAILAVSAHWFCDGLPVSDARINWHINDMYGFPPALYEVDYAPKGDPILAAHVADLVNAAHPRRPATLDDSWGIDHGVWSVLCHLYPKADVPVCMMGIDGRRMPREHYEVGRALAKLRDEGVLIIASGNVVHNLRLVDPTAEGGAPWACEFDDAIADAVLADDDEAVIGYESLGASARKAVPTPDHFSPLLVALGAASPDDDVAAWNRVCISGSLSMTSYTFEANQPV